MECVMEVTHESSRICKVSVQDINVTCLVNKCKECLPDETTETHPKLKEDLH